MPPWSQGSWRLQIGTPLTEGAGTTVKFLFLNLETATDRLAFMNDQFAALGMSAERIPAVAASTITTDLLVEMVHPDGEWLACKDEKISIAERARVGVLAFVGAVHNGRRDSLLSQPRARDLPIC